MRMVKILLTTQLLIISFISFAQYPATRQNPPLVREERYVTNSPGNGTTNSKLIEITKDSTYRAFLQPSIQLSAFGSSRNDGTPTSLIWADADGYLKRSPYTAPATPNVYNAGNGLTKTGTEPSATFAIDQSQVMTVGRATDSISSINSKVNGKVPQSRVLTINGVAQDLSADRTWTITKSSIGLGNVDNTSDANKPISNAEQTALNGKQATLVSGTNIKTVGGVSILGSGDIPVATNAVTSVFGRTGAVVSANGDYTTTQVTEGTNQYFTTARSRSSISAGTGISYNSTTGVVSASKRQETYSGVTNASGVYTVTFATAFPVAPNIQANLIGGTALQGTIITSITTTGFTVSAYTRATVSTLPVVGTLTATLVGTATNPLVGGAVDVIVTEK